MFDYLNKKTKNDIDLIIVSEDGIEKDLISQFFVGLLWSFRKGKVENLGFQDVLERSS